MSDVLKPIFVRVLLLAMIGGFGGSVQASYLPVKKAVSGGGKVSKFRSSSLGRAVCPADLKRLIEQLLPELPSYANRVIQRAQFSSQNYFPTSFILAGRAEFEPLSLNLIPPVSANTRQVFFTTLERQYQGSQIVEYEELHWIFLAKTARGWQLVTMFSQVVAPNSNGSHSGLEESNNSVTAEAIRLWLRDCEARG